MNKIDECYVDLIDHADTKHKKKKEKRNFTLWAKVKQNELLKKWHGNQYFVYRKYSSEKARLDALNLLQKKEKNYDFKIK